ncbi:Glycine--tRNA ligase beta subunit [bacterium HR11]|nr:Glycine--tRNA ligase beta subunit [bacterium HR11]
MDAQALVVEVGTEELPVEEQKTARQYIQEVWPERLRAYGWTDVPTVVWTTPRRIVLYVERFPAVQPTRTEVIKGPPKHTALDAEGRPTPALMGFLRRYGASPEDVRIEEGPRGAYVVLERQVPGRPAVEVLPEILTPLFESIPFRKRMRWPGSPVAFSRPVRWILALWGDTVVPWQFAGVTADRFTYGHRLLTGNRRIEVPDAARYEALLEEVRVLVSNEKRRQQFEAEIRQALADVPDARPVEDPELLDLWVHLTEWPTVLVGAFDPQFLRLPAEILITAMRHHQKYLAVVNSRGRLQPRFLTLLQTHPSHGPTVRTGHERVLVARFRDADFFWHEDCRQGLEAYAARLSQVQFLEGGGTYADKVYRLHALASVVAPLWRLSPPEQTLLEQAVRLAKADLVSQLVGEFPELEGIAGGLLARQEGRPEPLWRAIYEHVRPQRMEDPIPSTPLGQCLAFLDRLDSLWISFGLGHQPSGSRDPLGQRRWALGLLRILIEGGISADIPKLLEDVYRRLTDPSVTSATDVAKGRLYHDCYLKQPELLSFLQGRLAAYWEAQGARPDFIDSLIDRRPWDPWDLDRRLRAFRESDPDDVYRIGLVFKRLYSITKDLPAAPGRVETHRFQQDEERQLWEFYRRLREPVTEAIVERRYADAVRHLASLSPVLHTFFEQVFVMVEDADLRRNRLALLYEIRTLFEQLADFHRWQVEVERVF